MANMNIKFYGVRGSSPALSPDKVKVGGNTSCVLVETEDSLLIFDAGTGIINLGHDYGTMNNITAHIFLSHYHWDHIHGLPCFKPFYNKSNTFTLYGKNAENKNVEQIIKEIMMPPYFPIPINNMGSTIHFYTINLPVTFTINDNLTISTLPIVHPGGSVAYRLTYKGIKFCYMTDMDVTDNNEEEMIQFIKNCDLLVMDAYFAPEDYTKGSGHSNWKDVINLCKKSHVKQVALSHHHLFKTDEQLINIEKQVKNEMKEAFLAREGMIIKLY